MKITHVQCKKALFVPTLGELRQRTFDQQFYPGIEMKTGSFGITATYKGRCFLIPWGDVECVVFDNEAPAQELKVAKKA